MLGKAWMMLATPVFQQKNSVCASQGLCSTECCKWNHKFGIAYSNWCKACEVRLCCRFISYNTFLTVQYSNWIWQKWWYGDYGVIEMVRERANWSGFCEYGDCQRRVSKGGPFDENKGAVVRQGLSCGSCRGSWRNMAAGRKVCQVSLLPSCPPPIIFQTPFVFRYPWVNFFLLYFFLVDLYH